MMIDDLISLEENHIYLYQNITNHHWNLVTFTN